MNGVTDSTSVDYVLTVWQKGLIGVDVLFGALTILCLALYIRKTRKISKEQSEEELMNIKEFFGKAATCIYVSGLSVIALVVALIGYIMYGLEKNNLEAVIVVFTLIAIVAGLMEMILTLTKGYRPLWDNMTIVYAVLEAVATAIFAKNAASYIQSVSVGLAKLTITFEVAVVAYVLALVIAIVSGFLNRRKIEA